MSQNPFAFLITQLFELYIYVILLRFIFQWVRADFYNQVSQFIVKATNPFLIPLRKIIPGFGGIDLASIILAWGVNLAKYGLLMGFGLTRSEPILVLLVYTLIELLHMALGLFIFLSFIRIILSWIAPSGYNPMVALVIQVTDPLFKPFQRIIPPLGGLDLSPILMFMVLYFVRNAVAYYLFPLAFIFR